MEYKSFDFSGIVIRVEPSVEQRARQASAGRGVSEPVETKALCPVNFAEFAVPAGGAGKGQNGEEYKRKNLPGGR